MVAQRALRIGSLAPTRDYDATVYMDMQYLAIGDGAKQKMVTIWDFSGAPAYMAGLQQFVVDGSVYLLCVPCLLLTMLAGPMGFLAYYILRNTTLAWRGKGFSVRSAASDYLAKL